MSSTDAARRHRNGWTPERRAAQARAIRNWRPWTRSTGPRTPQGKAKVRYNGYKHGLSSRAMQRLKQAMKRQKAFLLRFAEQSKKHFKEQQRQHNAQLARHRKKMQWLHKPGRKNANNSDFFANRTIG